MLRNLILLLLFGLFSIQSSFSQRKNGEYNKEENKTEKSNTKILKNDSFKKSNYEPIDWKKRYYTSFHLTSYLDIIASPVSTVMVQTGTSPTNNPIIEPISSQTMVFNILTVGYEPRVNLIELSPEFAFAVSSPITIGLGSSDQANENLAFSKVFGTLQIPILAKALIGLGSTYASESYLGLSLGYGIEFNKLGILPRQSIPGEKLAFFQPVYSLGINFLRQGLPRELNLKIGKGIAKSYSIDKNGDPVSRFSGQDKLYTNSFSLRLSCIYLLNY